MTVGDIPLAKTETAEACAERCVADYRERKWGNVFGDVPSLWLQIEYRHDVVSFD